MLYKLEGGVETSHETEINSQFPLHCLLLRTKTYN